MTSHSVDEIERPVSYGEEPNEDTSAELFIKEDVSDMDIFRLAKSILLCVFFLFIAIAICRIFCTENKGITDVWEFSKTILNSVSSLVLGLYFGKKK
jgi:hypothetical protein